MPVVFLVLLNSSSNGLEARYESADPSYVVAYPGLAFMGVERRTVLGKKPRKCFTVYNIARKSSNFPNRMFPTHSCNSLLTSQSHRTTWCCPHRYPEGGDPVLHPLPSPVARPDPGEAPGVTVAGTPGHLRQAEHVVQVHGAAAVGVGERRAAVGLIR